MSNYLYNNYISFQKQLNYLVQNNDFFGGDDCFLIEKNDWEKLIYNQIDPYNKYKSNVLNTQNKIPEFIDNISSALQILKKIRY